MITEWYEKEVETRLCFGGRVISCPIVKLIAYSMSDLALKGV